MLPEVFRQEVCRGFDPKGAIQTLIRAGWLIRGATRSRHRSPGYREWVHREITFSVRRCGGMRNEPRLSGCAVAANIKIRGTTGDTGDKQCSCWLRRPPSCPTEGDKR